MVKHPWERHEDFKAALLAAREALDAAERAELAYYETVSKPESKVAWLHEQSREGLMRHKVKVMNEVYESVQHLKDAIGSWWDLPAPSWKDARMPGPWDAA